MKSTVRRHRFVFREVIIASHESEKRKPGNETTGTVGTGTKDRKGGGGYGNMTQGKVERRKNRPAKEEERDIANSGSHVGEQ